MDPSPPGPTPTKIAAGAYHTCILAGATTGVFCRGNNNDVQSGPTPPFLSCRAVPEGCRALVTNPPYGANTPSDKGQEKSSMAMLRLWITRCA